MADGLFTHFLVIRLIDQDDCEGGTLPRTELCFPGPAHSISTVPSSVLHFAFPDNGYPNHSNRLVSQSYKVSLGQSCFLFFRRHLQSRANKYDATNKNRKLECLCLITKYDLHEIFDFIMQQIQIRWLLSPNSVIPFLKSLLKQANEIPSCSGHIALVLRPSIDDQGPSENFLFHRPQFDHMGIPSHVLFELLSVDNVLALMSALLCEQRIIITSASINALSQSIHAARSLLYPFRWPYMFAAVLPRSMLHHVFSPSPFLIGMLDHHLKTISKLHIYPTLVVYLDTNELKCVGGEIEAVAISAVSSKLRARLGQIAPQGVLGDRFKKGLNTILGKSTDMDQILCSDAIYVSWMAFYVITFGAWRRYIETTATGTIRFNVIRFLEAARNNSEEDFYFFETFCHTKMFRAFIHELLAHSQSSLTGETYEFCRICSAVMRKNQLQEPSIGFHSTVDALKSVMYPNRCAQIASLALEITSSTAAANLDRISALSTLSQASFSSMGLREILCVIRYRLADCHGRSWRHASSTFELLQMLLHHGSDAVLAVMRDDMGQLVRFLQYAHKEDEVQSTIRMQVENVIKIVVDLPEQARLRSQNYSTIADSLLPFRIGNTTAATDGPHVHSPFETYAQFAARIGFNTHCIRSNYSNAFHASTERQRVDAANQYMSKYREKSLIKGRCRIISKFSKLHRNLAGTCSEYTGSPYPASSSAQFEDLLDLSALSTTDPSPLVATQLSREPGDWVAPWTTTQPAILSSNPDDFAFQFMTEPTLAVNHISSADTTQQQLKKDKPFDPFDELFK